MLFFSYSWGDAKCAHNIVDAIRKAGQSVWLDISHLDLSADVERQLVDAIRTSSLFLHLDSQYSRFSTWVDFERTVAKTFDKPVFDIPCESLLNALARLPANKPLHTEPRVARFLKSVSSAAIW